MLFVVLVVVVVVVVMVVVVFEDPGSMSLISIDHTHASSVLNLRLE